MRIGRTVSGERERVQSESERFAERKKASFKKMVSGLTFIAFLLVLAAAGAIFLTKFRAERTAPEEVVQPASTVLRPTVDVVDEAGVGVSSRMLEFAAYLEQDLKELGYSTTRVVIPGNRTREVDVYVAEFGGYFKTLIDRGAGVSAEDIDRMIRYLRTLNLTGTEYVDVRVDGKGYYKGEIVVEAPAPVEAPEPLAEEETYEPVYYYYEPEPEAPDTVYSTPGLDDMVLELDDF